MAIIGAGMAGLGAARTLIENGLGDVLILEGNDRPGGRIRTVGMGDGIIELGAQWLHNTTDSLYQLAVEHNLISDQLSDEGLGVYVRDDGHVYDDFLVKKISFQIGKILEDCENFVDADNYPASVGHFLERQFAEYVQNSEDSDDVKNMKLELYDWHVLFQVIDNSCLDLKSLSAKSWGKYACMGKDGQKHLNIRNGYQSLVDVLVRGLPKGALLLNKTVQELDYSLENVAKIELKCQDETILADYVIVTSSMACLKEFKNHIYPPLLDRLHRMIDDVGFNGMGKVFLFFKRKWWNTEGFQLVWRRSTKLYGEGKWVKYISGFDLVLGHDNALMAWVGAEGVEMMETLPEEIIGKHCVDLLKRFLKNDNIPDPINVVK